MRQTSVAVVLPSMVGGGAQRVASDLANHWSDQSRDVSLITIDRGDRTRFPLRENIHCRGLDLQLDSRSWWSAIRNNLRRIRSLRQAIQETSAQAIVSFTDVTNVTTLLACRGMRLRTIVCERTDPRHHQIGRAWDWLRRRQYGGASAIVVQTQSVRRWAESCGWKCPVVVIPNAAPGWAASTPASSEKRTPTVLAFGRLSEEKGFHLLIESFGRIASAFPEWELVIVGDGSERARLEQLVDRLKPASRIRLTGWVNDVEPVLRSARIFVLSSRYEGFPNALLEAMSAGLSCVSFDCESGPREIIRDGIDGLLIPGGNQPALEDALVKLMTDQELRTRLGTEARQVQVRFGLDEFYRRWDAVLDGQ